MAPLLGMELGNHHPAVPLPQKSILYIDAYDSFSYIVVAMLEETLPVRVTVMTIDSEWPDDMVDFLRHYEAVVIGPGPGNPSVATDVGIMNDIWKLERGTELPVLGICLGFQSLCLHYGVDIAGLPDPLHGQVRVLQTSGRDIFAGMDDVTVTLYHSLYARLREPKPAELDFLAWLVLDNEKSQLSADCRIPMAVRHAWKPYWGFQFHPESCKSDRVACEQLLRRWWDAALLYNKTAGRVVLGSLPETIVRPIDDSLGLSDAAYIMVNWGFSSTMTSANRSLPAGPLTPEMVFEKLNTASLPSVSFQSNGRYTVMSVLSSSSWKLEYYASAERLLLQRRLLGDPYVNDTAAGLAEMEADIELSISVNRLWDALRYLMEMKRVYSGAANVPFWGGLLGYFSYEMGLACLAHPKSSPAALPREEASWKQAYPDKDGSSQELPDVSLLWTERSVVYDNETKEITFQSTREADDAPDGWLDQKMRLFSDLLSGNLHMRDEKHEQNCLDSVLAKSVIQFPDEKVYKAQVEACKAQLAAGESYELCLTCETPIVVHPPGTAPDRAVFPWQLYKRLCKYNPAAFSAFAKLGRVKIASSSPECFLNWDRHSTLEMKPMKGTVRKTGAMTLDKARAILGSTKETAENLMIADLIRHDLYGICGSGHVVVHKLLEVEDHGRVYQMITHVKGRVDHRRLGVAVRHMAQLKSRNMSVHGITALQKCVPPGSMTGAPKERSCMHLGAIERRSRGVYSGVMGYLDLGGAGSFSVLIRTAFSCADDSAAGPQVWRVGAGGAVTTLSTADGEWEEMITKLRTVCGIFTPLEPDKEHC